MKMKEYLTSREFRSASQRRRYIIEIMRKRARHTECLTPGIGNNNVPAPAKSYLDDIVKEPEKRNLRIYFQNINTLKLGGNAEEDVRALKKVSAMGASIVCLSEINKNLEKKEVRYEVSRMLNETMMGAKYCAGRNGSYVTE